jgi:ankyrin repeat protein
MLEGDTLIDSCSTDQNDLFPCPFRGPTEHAKGVCGCPSTAHDGKSPSLSCELEEHLSIVNTSLSFLIPELNSLIYPQSDFTPSDPSFLLEPNLLSPRPEGKLTSKSCDRRIPGRTLLHEGVILDNQEMVSVLLGHVADVEARDNDGRTPLHLAAALGHERAGRLLLMHGAAATLLMVDGYGMTAMHLAVQNGHTRMVKALLEFGADANLRF